MHKFLFISAILFSCSANCDKNLSNRSTQVFDCFYENNDMLSYIKGLNNNLSTNSPLDSSLYPKSYDSVLAFNELFALNDLNMNDLLFFNDMGVLDICFLVEKKSLSADFIYGENSIIFYEQIVKRFSCEYLARIEKLSHTDVQYYPHHIVLSNCDFTQPLTSYRVNALSEYMSGFLKCETDEEYENLYKAYRDMSW